MSKLERLLNLTAALLETEQPLPAEVIHRRVEGYAEAHQSFRRAFERDKEDLREMGIPLSLEPVPGSDPPVDGYRIHKSDYYLDDPGLEPDELAALHLAAGAVRVEGISGAEALRKLGGAVGETPAEALASLPADPNLPLLFGAMAARRVATFTYRGERREVEIHRLDFVRGRWYVSGHDRTRDADRHFRIDRMESGVQLGRPDGFVRPDHPGIGLRLEPWQLGDAPARTARLLIDADQADWARHHVGSVAEDRDDGSVVLALPVTNDEAFLSFVLSFLDHAEILDPPDLRAALVAWLERIVHPEMATDAP